MTTPCVWLHGTALAGVRWHDSLPGDWPYLPGHGTAPRSVPTISAFASYLVARLPKRFVIGGHSVGGMVALDLAVRLRDRCAGLILIDTPMRLPKWMPRRPLAAQLVAWPKVIGPCVQFRTSNRAIRAEVRRAASTTPRGGLLDAIRAAMDFDGRTLASQVTAPTLSLLGATSLLTGDADHIGETHVYNDAGHMLPMDQPQRTADDITSFLERHA